MYLKKLIQFFFFNNIFSFLDNFNLPDPKNQERMFYKLYLRYYSFSYSFLFILIIIEIFQFKISFETLLLFLLH